jgi:translation initiation factor 2 subunit 2
MESFYTEEFMLDRGIEELGKREKKKKGFVKPEISSFNQKTYISNFNDFCKSMNRENSSVKTFIESELQCMTVIINENGDEMPQSLKIEGKYKPAQLTPIFTRYIEKYVICKNCKSSFTTIYKKNRILTMKCGDCLSENSV